MSRRISDAKDERVPSYETQREVLTLQDRIDELEECVEGYDIGALYTKSMTRILELEEENERLKKVLGAVCQECGVDPYEVLGGKCVYSPEME